MAMDELKDLLNKENELLDAIASAQGVLRNAVTDKDWDTLLKTINIVNALSERFQELDVKRDEIQSQFTYEQLQPVMEEISKVRSKLLKCKVENKILGDYVAITKSFVQEVIEKALPKNRNKGYTRTGKIVEAQPASVMLNQLF